MNLVLAESSSSLRRLHDICRIRPSITLVVTPNAKVVKMTEPHIPTIVLVTAKEWPSIWTLWGGNYRVPPETVCEKVYSVTMGLLARKKIAKKLGGAFKNGFVWGCVPNATGICAKERMFVGGGGLFLEHYIMARVAGMSSTDAHATTLAAARHGRVTPLPVVSKDGAT